jgi:hypothetical protein
MSQYPEEPQNVLFVFAHDGGQTDEQFNGKFDLRRFWVYDGSLYHRFLWNAEGIRFVRSQAYLPKFSVGICLELNPGERQALEEEAAGYGIAIPFFESEEECREANLLIQHDQMIYDQTVPGGYFYIGNGLERSKGNEEEND